MSNLEFAVSNILLFIVLPVVIFTAVIAEQLYDRQNRP